MKAPKIFHCRLSKTGRTYPVTVKTSHYTNNNTLAVILIEASAPWSPFATITVNLSGFFEGLQDDTHAYIDTNNCPWAEEFLQDNGIAKPYKGWTGQSGFCTYPMYEFDLDSIWEEHEDEK